MGHPVHVMLVHFPTALFTFSFVCDLWGVFAQNPELHKVSLIGMAPGVALGALAATFGAIDYIKLVEDKDLFRKASWHAGIQLCVLMAFGMTAGMRIQDYPNVSEPGMGQLLIMGLAVAAMLVGNYLGGDLVFRHGIGVRQH